MATWAIYQDRNGWMAGEALATADTLASAKREAERLGARYVASPLHGTYWRGIMGGRWAKA